MAERYLNFRGAYSEPVDDWKARMGRELSMPTALSPDALSVLARAEKNGPVVCKGINPGIARKLVSEGWCTLEWVRNPYATGPARGRLNQVQALAITEKGKARIAFDKQ